MNKNETTKISKNSFSFAGLSIAGIAIFMGVLLSVFPSHRQYFPVGVSKQDNDGDIGDAIGMEQFFFTARKNSMTGKMDYPSMLAADIADRAMNTMHTSHSVSSTSMPTFSWTSMGPTNVGGRTRAILIDNNDPTHQTIFAGGVTGGIWKSVNGGGTWDNASSTISYSLNDTLANMNICCIAQDSKGAIYIGTGEGFTAGGGSEFSSGELGGGIFKSTNDGLTWRLLPSTVPSPLDDANVKWSYVNRIAIRPDSFQVIYAATNQGLLVSHDSGFTWATATNSLTLGNLNQNTLDVKISNDGSVIVACCGGNGYYCYPQTGNPNVFTRIPNTGVGHLNGNATRIEFAISPTDANRIYASVIQGGDPSPAFGGDGLSGIFMTMTAKTNGGYWYDIGPGGSTVFDPYNEPGPGVYDQATYDNTVGVPPANEAQVLVGGTTLWEWSGSSTSDTVGEWEKISHYSPYYNGDPLWIHADEHAIVFDQNNPSVVYIGCDGGMFKCSNMIINPGDPTRSIAGLDIEPINRNYNVTQYYTVCYSPEVNYMNVSNNNNFISEGLGLGGGTQDNGSPYVNGSIADYPNDGTDLSGGDGAGAAVSQLDPDIAYFCSDFGTLLREGNLGTLSPPTIAYTKSRGYDQGGNIDSIAGLGGACFVFPVALYENSYDLLNHDSVLFIADSNFALGHTVWPISANANATYPYVLPKALAIGDTLKVPDRVVSRLAVGFSGTAGGIWINGQGAGLGTVVWMPIGGPLSKPDAFSDNAPVHALAWTPDGNTLFAGTEDGTFFRFLNINSIIADSYKSGALWSNGGSKGIVDTTNQVYATNLGAMFSGRDILSISVDPNNGNNVMVTVGNYGNSDYVYYSTNALDTSALPTFSIVQGNLPAMPVYSSIVDVLDSNGNSIPGSAMIGTEHGIYYTSTLGSLNHWTKCYGSSGMPYVMTLALKQQTTKPWMCNNASVIYAGTHGRGLWASTTEYKKIQTAVPNIIAPVALNDLLVYPNPMTSQGNIAFNLTSEDNVTVTIYDMQGHEVKTINIGSQAQGSHLITFASDELRSGTYFASLTGTNFRKVSKFVVVK